MAEAQHEFNVEGCQKRRSFRLKNKPSPRYTYLRPKMPLGNVNSKEKLKFDRVSIAERSKKYDDLLDSVVANVMMSVGTSTPKFLNTTTTAKLGKRKIIEKRPRKPIIYNMDTQISNVPKEVPVLPKCSCGVTFEKHIDCHSHIVKAHTEDDLLVRCMSCELRYPQIFRNCVCCVCGDCFEDLEDHVASHYRNSTSRTAVMECRFCVRQFVTVREVMEHEKEKHLEKTRKRRITWKCSECEMVFPSQEAIIVHYSEHFNITELWREVTELQMRILAPKEECPFCRLIIASRKGFRGHVLRIHYAACKSIAGIPSAIEVKQEVEEMIQNAKEIKKEVKDEVIDEGYPQY